MDSFIGIMLFIIIIAAIYHYFSNPAKVDLEEERDELKANLESMMEELEALEQIIEEPDETEDQEKNKLLRLKAQVASRRLNLKTTVEKIKVEGDRNWGYRKMQAMRTLKKTRKFTNQQALKEYA
ncbi:MAG: hypothetical protein Roseis2KO_02490 [Roseivirga sp.]